MVVGQHIFHEENWLKMKILYLKKLSGKIFFAIRDIKEVQEYWLIYFMLTPNMKDYMVENIEEKLRKVFRDTMEGQFEHDFLNKSFSNQFESDDEVDTLQQRIKWLMVVVDRGGGGPMPNDV